jgi:hypothetical protein
LGLGASNRFLDWANGERLRTNRLAGIRLVRRANQLDDLNIVSPYLMSTKLLIWNKSIL